MDKNRFHVVDQADFDEINLARSAGKIVVVVAHRPEHAWSLGVAATWIDGWLAAIGIASAQGIVFRFAPRGHNLKAFGRKTIDDMMRTADKLNERAARKPPSDLQ